MSALGLIETKGLIAAIEAADAMVKAADVRILEKHTVGGGLVTITVTGEVSAVRASMDAAITAVSRIKGAELISHHVIASPYDDISSIIATEIKQPLLAESQTDATTMESPETSSPAADTENIEVAVVEKIDTPDEHSEPQKGFTVSQLQKMQVSKLRRLVVQLSGISLSKQEIKTATKNKLIEAILNATSR